uniref:D-aminoacyl-tRNA deacylase n=1 Tax=uncultured marine group II/III euryarchaeote KM3_139_C07 TaxID=1457870 RepID=A0A075GFL8_9EURY|nr:D-aminoacyl-tRNA deacylase [uncultured marine group II/III euryarchaeote KM3_139_C07]
MQIAIICSTKDQASMNIREQLLPYFKETDKKFDNHKIYEKQNKENHLTLYTTDIESVYYENIDKKIQADLFIFATKHVSKSGIHSLSVHFPGNWGKAELGGKDKTLCIAPSSILKTAFLELNKLKTDYEIIQECTHHGPYINKPAIFIEIGSDKKQWQDKKAGKNIAKVILKITEKNPKYKAVIAFGGLHHSPNFKKILLNTEFAVSHVCPKYNLENLNKNNIEQAIEKTVEKVEFIVLDWKGLGQEKNRIIKILEELNIKYKKSKEF